MQASRSKALTYGLLGVNGLLGAMLWLLLGTPVSTGPALPEPPPPAALALPTEPLPHPPASQFQEMADRPLFWAERRPEETAPAEVAGPAPSASTLTLLGVVITGAEQRALLQKRGDPQVLRAAVGDVVEGWTVMSIGPKRVLLDRDGAAAELVLNEQAEKEQGTPNPRRAVHRPR